MSRAPSSEAAAARPAELDLVLRALRLPDVRHDLLAVTRSDARASCRVLDVKYSPGRSCTVLYSVGGHLVSGDVELDGADGRATAPVRPRR